ncbi:kinase-like domain-containing protein [Dactylonectria estremocensis]|uniref:mitogen-activated protein kinase kinase n=1 Tax=Dactylonectria estremocensis TaxID=1079267 RepID=A0A9P9J458_9HYPO|nr:kinase-like domain-containing protein [Dactylonectria estremocensis]
MAETVSSLIRGLPDLVRDWQLDIDVRDGYTIQTSYTTNPAEGLWRARVEEKWERRQELGFGAYGVVDLQECTSGPSSGQTRAVKQIRIGSSLHKEDAKALPRELLAVVKFSHERYRDRFVRSFGWYYTQGSIFITMEHLSLGNLESYLQAPLPESQAKLIILQILFGLADMHRNDVAHRDMKPSNILVQQKGPNWWVKIADFGCSKQYESTGFHTLRGTEPYLAPELHRFLLPGADGTHTAAVDIWAVGTIAFRIAAGRLPFQTPPGPDLQAYVAGGAFPAGGSLSKECTSFITQTMRPYPSERPSAEEALKNPWISSSSALDTSKSSVEVAAVDKTQSSTAKIAELYSNQWSTINGASFSKGNTRRLPSTLSTLKPDYFSRKTAVPYRQPNVASSGVGLLATDKKKSPSASGTPTPENGGSGSPLASEKPNGQANASSVLGHWAARRAEREALPNAAASELAITPKPRLGRWKKIKQINDLDFAVYTLAFSPNRRWLGVKYTTYESEFDILTIDRSGNVQSKHTLSSNPISTFAFASNHLHLITNPTNRFEQVTTTWQHSQGGFKPLLKHDYILESPKGKEYVQKDWIVCNMSLSPDGRRLFLTWGRRQYLRHECASVWEADSDGHYQWTRDLECFDEGMSYPIFSPDGRWCIQQGELHSQQKVRLSYGRRDAFVTLKHMDTDQFGDKKSHYWENSTVFSPDSRWLLLVSREFSTSITRTTILELSTSRGRHEKKTIRHTGKEVGVSSHIVFSRDSRRFALGRKDGLIEIWELEGTDDFLLKQKLEGHAAEVWGLDFSADNQLLASSSEDKTVIIWELS